MEIETKDSYLKLNNFNNKELLTKCVADIYNSLNEYPEIKIGKNICNQRRCVGFFSNESIGYSYSNQISIAKPMTNSLLYLRNIFETNFNGILVNINQVKIIFQNIVIMKKL